MPIPRPDFAEESVHQGLRFGVHPHYLVAVAELRSGISDASAGDRIGPFRLTQTEWDANSSDEEFNVTDFVPDDINAWDMQCCIYALMTLRAQNRCLVQLGRLPSAVELYQAQWPNDPAQLPNALQDALDKTSGLMDVAFTNVIGAPPEPSATIGVQDVTATPDPDLDRPVPAKGTETFVAKAPRIMEKLISDFGLKDFQAAGILGNIGLECDGFREMQEKKPLIRGSRGGFGWAQWTGPRRTEFEAFCSSKGLSLFSDAANYGFFKQELNTTQSMSLTAVQKAASISKAVRTFEATFERAKAGLEHFDRRDQWADLALRSFRASADTMVPPAVAALLDPGLIHRVIARANLGNATYLVVDQFSDEGGQVLVKQESGQNPSILATDTTILPLKAGLVPASVAAQLSASFDGAAADPAPVQVQRPASDAVASAQIFAMAKQCDETLVTRNAPNTNHGRLACAFAVNEVVRRAIGRAVGGGTSTANMGEILAETQRQVPEQEIAPGMIIISPTHGSNVGHVGIVGEIKSPITATLIYSNSSARGVFSHLFTLGKWKAFYRDSKGLPVFFFGIRA
jgi:Phage tail lysozyme